MAATLHRAGFTLMLWNRDRQKAEDLARALDALVAPNPAEAVSRAMIALTSLADDRAVREVYLGTEGLAGAVLSDKIAIDTSTVDPETTEEIGVAVAAAGGTFLDCPVSGSVSAANTGTLTIMAGGDSEGIARARPVLDALAARVIPTGRQGSGAATKLAVNGLVHGLNVALCEALVLAERAGIDRLTAYEVFASGAGGAPFVQYKREAFESPETAPVGFSLDLASKDLELITRLGHRVGATMEQAEVGLRLIRRAIEAGFGSRDLSSLAVFLRGT